MIVSMPWKMLKLYHKKCHKHSSWWNQRLSCKLLLKTLNTWAGMRTRSWWGTTFQTPKLLGFRLPDSYKGKKVWHSELVAQILSKVISMIFAIFIQGYFNSAFAPCKLPCWMSLADDLSTELPKLRKVSWIGRLDTWHHLMIFDEHVDMFLQNDVQSPAKQRTLIPASEAFESSRYGWFDHTSWEAYRTPSMNTCLPYNVIYRLSSPGSWSTLFDVFMTVLDLQCGSQWCALYLAWPRHAMAFGPEGLRTDRAWMWGWTIVNLPSDKLTPPWPLAGASNNVRRLLLRKKKLLGFCARCYTSNLQQRSFHCSPSIAVFYAQSRGVEAYSLHFGAFLFQQFLLAQPHWHVQEPTWSVELDHWKTTDTLFRKSSFSGSMFLFSCA